MQTRGMKLKVVIAILLITNVVVLGIAAYSIFLLITCK